MMRRVSVFSQSFHSKGMRRRGEGSAAVLLQMCQHVLLLELLLVLHSILLLML